MKLTAEQLDHQKTLLLTEKERLSAEIKKLSKYPDYGDFKDDVDQEITDFETNMSIEDSLKLVLKKVDLALKAIESGTYGTCKECGIAVESGRLESMPYAELCVTCKSCKPSNDRKKGKN